MLSGRATIFDIFSNTFVWVHMVWLGKMWYLVRVSTVKMHQASFLGRQNKFIYYFQFICNNAVRFLNSYLLGSYLSNKCDTFLNLGRAIIIEWFPFIFSFQFFLSRLHGAQTPANKRILALTFMSLVQMVLLKN